MGSIYFMSNLNLKQVVIIYDIIWLKKTYDKYVSIFEHIQDCYYFILDWDDYDILSNVKTNIVKAENFSTKQNHRVEEDVPNIAKSIALKEKK